MSDRYKEIRQALEMGPTPGPWLLDKFHPHITDAARGSSQVLVCKVATNTRNDEGRKNEAYIAACHPEAIRALLAERDALREALKDLIAWFPSAGTYRRLGFDPEAPMRAFEKARAALKQEKGGSDVPEA